MAHYKRITKREIVKGPDEFVGFWTKAYYWSVDNTQTILGYAMGAIAVILIIAGIFYYRQNAESSASAELFKIMKDSPKLGAERDAGDVAKISDQLASFATKRSGTQAGREAMLYRANLLDQKKDAPEAEKIYKEVMGGKSDVMAQIACLGLASTYQNEGKFPDALTLLEKFRQNSLFEEEMNFMYAHNQELANNKVEAVKEYKKFMEKYPSSRHTAEAKESLARLS